MQFINRLWLISVLQSTIAATSVLSAQTWNAPTAIETVVGDETSLIEGIRYTNWQWVDPNGVLHSFPGSTFAGMKYTAWIDMDTMGRKNGRPYITSLVNVKASDGSELYLNARGGVGTVTSHEVLYPKYQVLSVIYAPPGASSNVVYGSSSSLGSSSSISRTFANNTSLSATVGGTFFGLFGGTTTYSLAYNTSLNNSSSISINKSESTSIAVRGPASSLDGINHDYDIITICLNPAVHLAASSYGNAQWTIATDITDTRSQGMADVISLYVYQFKNPSTITDPYILEALNRSWAGPNRGLDSNDFATILARNPFWNDGKNGSSPLADNPRFQLVGSSTFNYVPPPVGGQPYTEAYSIQYQTLSQNSKTATDSYSVSSASQTEVNFFIKAKINWGSQMTWTNVATNAASTGFGQTASLSLTGPTAQYTGPVQLKVYQDVLYGTFLFSYVR